MTGNREYLNRWYPKGTLKEPYLPQDIDLPMQVFPAGIEHLLPPATDIPDEYLNNYGPHQNLYQLFDTWFYSGIGSLTYDVRDGIDEEKARRHIRTIMGSWDPKHEYKRAAIVFLLDKWFSNIKWEPKKK